MGSCQEYHTDIEAHRVIKALSRKIACGRLRLVPLGPSVMGPGALSCHNEALEVNSGRLILILPCKLRYAAIEGGVL
jgi:hypothetical protein